MLLAASDIGSWWNPQVGHAHFAERAVSRRHFLARTALAGGAAATASLWAPALAAASAVSGGTPTPIPETLDGTPFHLQLPAADTELSLINNFNGVVGVADISGVGTGDGGSNLTYEVDLRFMSGRFIGTDGHLHQGTFGFV
jgi:hypothetical protein